MIRVMQLLGGILGMWWVRAKKGQIVKVIYIIEARNNFTSIRTVGMIKEQEQNQSIFK